MIDFEANTRNPVTLTNLQSAPDNVDGWHPNPTDYRVMADVIDLNLFAPKKIACPSRRNCRSLSLK